MKTFKFASFFPDRRKMSIPEQLQPPDRRGGAARRVLAPQTFPLPRLHPEVHAKGRDRPGVSVIELFSSSLMPRQNKLDRLSRSFSLHLIISKQHFQWVKTNPSNICIFPTDICFIAASW
jgi:hypothetical protein